MSTHVVVIDTTFRRTTIKVNPGTYLNDVLEEACKKLKLNADNYGFKNNNKNIDMSRTFRQSGLTSGAKLELVVASRSPSVVSIALQLPEQDAKGIPGGRLMEKFASTTTMWMILRHFESANDRNLNLTGRGVAQTESCSSGAGRIHYETPVLQILGKNYSTFTELQKTLSSLGLKSGSGLIRLSFEKTDKPLDEAMLEIGEYFRSIEAPPADGAHANSTGQMQSIPSTDFEPAHNTITGEPDPAMSSAMDLDPVSDAAGPSESLPPPTDNSDSISDAVVVGPNQRPIEIFAAPHSDTPQAALHEHSESDYEPSIAHMKLHQTLLQGRTQNAKLLSDAEEAALAEQKAARKSTIKEVSIKVRFPDQLTVVSTFTNIDTGATLYEFVSGVMAAPEEPFALVWSSAKGPKTVPRDTKARLIGDLDFRGRMLINFNWEDGASQEARNATTLKPAFASKAKELQVQQIAAVEAETKAEGAKLSNGDKGQPKQGEGKSKGVPKWLKLPGKK